MHYQSDSHEISPRWETPSIVQELTMVEVDLVVLSRELQLLADMCTRIKESLRKERQSLEQELT